MRYSPWLEVGGKEILTALPLSLQHYFGALLTKRKVVGGQQGDIESIYCL